jgi:hypothetical protein
VTVYEHEIMGDIPIGEAWILRSHCEKHIEIVGGSGQGKTTLAEWLMLGILERRDAGLLLIDPTGDSYRKYVGWLSEGTINRPAYLVDPAEIILRYNPLAVEKDPKELASHVAGLYEALHLIQSDTPAGQHRQMQRFVTSTLRALIEADLTLADAYDWLTDENFRTRHLAKIKHEETRKEWLRVPSRNDLKSTENWFAVFWEHDALKGMYSGNGFDWRKVYDEQALVLLNLRSFAGSLRYSRAIAAMFITGLLSHARQARETKLWYVVVDDATDYTPAHVGQLLTLGRHFDLYLVLIHHQEFPGTLQRAVDIGCRTKFIFGEIPREYRWQVSGYTPTGRPSMVDGPTHLGAYQALHIFDGRVVQTLNVEPTPEPYEDPASFKASIFEHPWYGDEKREERAKAAPSRKKPPRPPIAGGG